MQKIFLIGYMGAGKTTIGKRLARRLNMQFIDLDAFIENRYHQSVSSIFKEKGESGFREIERKMLDEVSQFEDVVVSTGGGAPCFFDNMAKMNAAGVTVYLKTGVDELVRRLLLAKDKRPLVSGKSPEELKDFITENLGQRSDIYNQAQIVCDADRMQNKNDVEEIVRNVERKNELLINVQNNS